MTAPNCETAKIVTAAMVVIGDEILSGRTQDKNVTYVATSLGDAGIQLREVRVIPDDTSEIVAAVNHCRHKYDYVFTSGGIGPTHDDITADAIAAAFDVGIDYHPQALALLSEMYEKSGIDFNDARKRMTRIPDGATLVDNPISKAPGFRLENVFVMAGVPNIMQAMMQSILPELTGGDKVLNRTIGASIPEGKIAESLGALQQKFPTVSMGSYPYFKKGQIGTNLVLRATDTVQLDLACAALQSVLSDMDATFTLS